MLMVLAVWSMTGALQIHRLRLDLEKKDYEYRKGFFLAKPLRTGTLDEISGVFIERYESVGGLETSRLRSRIVTFELETWPEEERSFVLGFPMGPNIAEEKAADYARRLRTQVIDRTAEEDPGPTDATDEEASDVDSADVNEL